MPFHYLETIMLLSVMPYRSKVLSAAVLSALKNIMHFSNIGELHVTNS